MTAFQKYQAWMQKSRVPALFAPTTRFWLGMAFITTCMHLGTNGSHWVGDMSWMIWLPFILLFTFGGIVLSPVIFQRYVGDMNLGQGVWVFNLASASRIVLMAVIYGWIAIRFRTTFDPLTLLKLPIVMLTAGFIFELTLGQISWFKPTPATKSIELESAT